MFKAQLKSSGKAALNTAAQIPALNDIFGGMPTGTEFDWGLGGILTLTPFKGRSSGTLSWGGLPNLLLYIDRYVS